MEIRYPNGLKKTFKKKRSVSVSKKSAANRGMPLEDNINLSNEFYKEKGRAFILKRPTPINVVEVDYSKGALITRAYFEKQSTTDYNGVYKGKYIDFEAKSTRSKTSFPLSNITKHQIEHLKGVISLGGIAFFIIHFEIQDETYLLDAKYVMEFYSLKDRKSIPYQTFKEDGVLIKKGYYPPLMYLDAVDEYYFNESVS